MQRPVSGFVSKVISQGLCYLRTELPSPLLCPAGPAYGVSGHRDPAKEIHFETLDPAMV